MTKHVKKQKHRFVERVYPQNSDVEGLKMLNMAANRPFSII